MVDSPKDQRLSRLSDQSARQGLANCLTQAFAVQQSDSFEELLQALDTSHERQRQIRRGP